MRIGRWRRHQGNRLEPFRHRAYKASVHSRLRARIHSQKQAITGEHGIPYLNTHTIRRMSRQTARDSGQRPNRKALPVMHEPVESLLQLVALETVYWGEPLLHVDDPGPDVDWRMFW
jgi:hypothetical protein